MNNFFNFDDRLLELSEKALEMSRESFDKIQKIQEYNQQKMLKAFQLAGVSESHFAGSTGYGYDDRSQLRDMYHGMGQYSPRRRAPQNQNRNRPNPSAGKRWENTDNNYDW